MNILNFLFVATFVILVMSFGAGMILGGPAQGRKVIIWELKMLAKIGRWILKRLLQIIADLCEWAHKKL